jgi:hypothetical protein
VGDSRPAALYQAGSPDRQIPVASQESLDEEMARHVVGKPKFDKKNYLW